MKDILKSAFILEMTRTMSNMYRLGWDERNGGNISLFLKEDEIKDYVDINKVIREIPLGFDAKETAGDYYLVTGTGKYFKNAEYDPEDNLGLFRISKDGTKAELLWGYKDGGKFTSELPAHIMSHMARRKVEPNNRVVLHSHPTYTLAMTHVHTDDEKEFTKDLWRMNNECIVVFPEGISVLPWMMAGTNEIGEATAEKVKTSRLVVWSLHGIYGVGNTLDEAFGLIETVEKSAEIYIKTMGMKRVNMLTDRQMHDIAMHYGVKYKEGYLDI